MQLRRVAALLCAALLLVSLCACAGENPWADRLTDVEKNPVALMEIQDCGTVTIELYPEMAPQTVCNFISLANSGYYDGIVFHRTVVNFVLQGGDPTASGTGGPGYSIHGEFPANNWMRNTLSHLDGVISMARLSNDFNSAGSQFFFCVGDQTSLDGQYAAFGKIIDGYDAMYKAYESGLAGFNPTITSVRVETYGVEYPLPDKIGG